MTFDSPMEQEPKQNREYAVAYISQSRGTSLDINDPVRFNDFHLVAAIQKAKRQMRDAGLDGREVDVFEAMCREAGYRDLNPEYKGGKGPNDPRIPVKSGDDAMDERHPQDEGFA